MSLSEGGELSRDLTRTKFQTSGDKLRRSHDVTGAGITQDSPSLADKLMIGPHTLRPRKNLPPRDDLFSGYSGWSTKSPSAVSASKHKEAESPASQKTERVGRGGQMNLDSLSELKDRNLRDVDTTIAGVNESKKAADQQEIGIRVPAVYSPRDQPKKSADPSQRPKPQSLTGLSEPSVSEPSGVSRSRHWREQQASPQETPSLFSGESEGVSGADHQSSTFDKGPDGRIESERKKQVLAIHLTSSASSDTIEPATNEAPQLFVRKLVRHDETKAKTPQAQANEGASENPDQKVVVKNSDSSTGDHADTGVSSHGVTSVRESSTPKPMSFEMKAPHSHLEKLEKFSDEVADPQTLANLTLGSDEPERSDLSRVTAARPGEEVETRTTTDTRSRIFQDLRMREAQVQPKTTTVKVTIGQIEVRAVTPPAPPAIPAQRRRSGPTLSLDDYLKQRSEERR